MYKTTLAELTLYSENCMVFWSCANIFNANVDAAVIFLDVVDNQRTPTNIQTTSAIAIGQVATWYDVMAFGILWWLIQPVHWSA